MGALRLDPTKGIILRNRGECADNTKNKTIINEKKLKQIFLGVHQNLIWDEV